MSIVYLMRCGKTRGTKFGISEYHPSIRLSKLRQQNDYKSLSIFWFIDLPTRRHALMAESALRELHSEPVGNMAGKLDFTPDSPLKVLSTLLRLQI